jgi:phosphonate transport system substrate-binding protein
MRIINLVLFALLALLILLHDTRVYADSSPNQITIGFIPGDSPEKLKASSVQLAKLLQEKTGVEINVHISKDYQGLIEAMKQKKIDFAFFSAMTFVFAEKQAGAKVLLKKVWEGPFYYSALVTKKTSKIKRVEDLKGKTVSFVDEKSGSGYLYPKMMLKKKGIDPQKFFKSVNFAGNHQNAILDVVHGKADAAAVFSDSTDGKKSAWKHFSPETLDQQKLLWISEPIPNDPFCVRQDFYDKYPRVTHDLMFALIELDDYKGKNMLKDLLNVNEMQTATSRHYEPVRELVRELDLKLGQ